MSDTHPDDTPRILTCPRCGGHFTAPGMAQDGKAYCCDKCAAGPRAMLPKMLPRALAMATLLVTGGAFLGAWWQRNKRM